MNKKQKGITLIALAVTIIVILILAGVTLVAMNGEKGIIHNANNSKSQTERKEVIEKAKLDIASEVLENEGNGARREELKAILEKYFVEVPDEYTLETELTAKKEYGSYKIKVSEMYGGEILLSSEESENNKPTETTSSTNTSNTGESKTDIDVTGIKLDKQTATVDLNGEKTVKLNAQLQPNNANINTGITWTSKKKTVASVDEEGVVTGKAIGNSMIMATTEKGYSAECLVVCQAKITGITVEPVTAQIPVGKTIQLTATTSPGTITEKITWKSRNEKVAKVDNNGNVTGIGTGTTEVIVQNPEGTITATCRITVQAALISISLDKTELIFDLSTSKNREKLNVIYNPSTASEDTNITWESENSNIAQVDQSGNVTAQGNGSTIIRATAQNGYTAQCSVVVQTSITSLDVSPTSKTLYIGETVQLAGTVNPNSTTEEVQWTSSDTNVATVSDIGLVTAKTAGTATITLKNSSETKSASCIITVENYKEALETESYVGYYADVDGDGTVDGIIFADLLHGKTGQWGDSNGAYTIPTIESTKKYKISQEDYTDQLGGTSKILKPVGDGADRFYVMALTDLNVGGYSTYYWYNSAYGQMSDYATYTSVNFGSGKENTRKMIIKWNNKGYGSQDDRDLWKHIQNIAGEGKRWFVPSRGEWSAFGGELGITKDNYASKGLKDWCWSSSQGSTSLAWFAIFENFKNSYVYSNYVLSFTYVRLSATF